MRTRAVILAGGEGTRLGVLTAKRTKPAVPFAGKYRIIDFPLSNCVNSNIFDLMIIAQYRPQSLIEHIGSGSPWDLNRDFTGGVRIYTPFKARASGWFLGPADAVQQNFLFIKRGDPDLILILSGDHVYGMNYEELIQTHIQTNADMTMATIRVSPEEASRFGIVDVDQKNQVTTFLEKPALPPSTQANMGVYVFSHKILSEVLWEDRQKKESTHDFGRDIIPDMIKGGHKVFAHPYTGYWVDVGTTESYWKAHMDLLATPSPFNLNDRNWVIHTRTEERPPVRIGQGAEVFDSLLCNGCIIEPGARVVRSVLSPGVIVHSGAEVYESILLTDVVIHKNARVERSIMDKRSQLGENGKLGKLSAEPAKISMVGKNALLPPGIIIDAGVTVGPDVIH